MSASKPSTMPKRFSAARLEDQEDIENMAREPIRMGTPPFSSPDPATDGVRMLPLEGGHGSVGTTLVGDENSSDSGDDYSKLSPAELKELAEERGLEVKGTGANGNVKKVDLVSALQQDDTKDMKAADWKKEIEEAADQDALDEIATRYDDSGASYTTVKAAIEKRQEEFNASDDDNDN